MLADASPTPYDLRFELLGVPVRVHPGFWVIAVFLGMNLRPQLLPAWVGAVFVSILVHELGHAAAQARFGGRPGIVLYTMGGFSSAGGVDRDWWKNVLIALAGPAAGFVLWGAVWFAVSRFGFPSNAQLGAVVEFLLVVNLVWGVINLAPIWPLDGGHVVREVLTRFLKPSTGIFLTLAISIVASAVVAALLWARTGSFWNLLLFGMLGFQNYQALVAYRRSRGAW